MREESVARYPYRDGAGSLLFEVRRYSPKRFELLDPRGKLVDDFPCYVLYRLPGLAASAMEVTVYIAEGEKDADRLTEEGLLAVTNPGGCRKGWRPEYCEPMRGRHAVMLPDADGPGRRHAETVAA